MQALIIAGYRCRINPQDNHISTSKKQRSAVGKIKMPIGQKKGKVCTLTDVAWITDVVLGDITE